jgi:hypothetical protein
VAASSCGLDQRRRPEYQTFAHYGLREKEDKSNHKIKKGGWDGSVVEEGAMKKVMTNYFFLLKSTQFEFFKALCNGMERVHDTVQLSGVHLKTFF